MRSVACSMTKGGRVHMGHICRHVGSVQKADRLLCARAGTSARAQGWMDQLVGAMVNG